MATTQAVVQLPEEGPGKKLDFTTITRADGTVVYRQVVCLGDPDDETGLYALDFVDGVWRMSVRATSTDAILRLILAELKTINSRASRR